MFTLVNEVKLFTFQENLNTNQGRLHNPYRKIGFTLKVFIQNNSSKLLQQEMLKFTGKYYPAITPILLARPPKNSSSQSFYYTTVFNKLLMSNFQHP